MGMKETDILARLVKLRDDMDTIIEKAWEEREIARPESDEDFEAGIRYVRWSSVRDHIEDAILEIELWE